MLPQITSDETPDDNSQWDQPNRNYYYYDDYDYDYEEEYNYREREDPCSASYFRGKTPGK
ncbi:MAG: hypothetical protein IPL86_07570 [Flavobacteriales bacterium]|nr:hypothetical protein [Flavobacteriales bacterium]